MTGPIEVFDAAGVRVGVIETYRASVEWRAWRAGRGWIEIEDPPPVAVDELAAGGYRFRIAVDDRVFEGDLEGIEVRDTTGFVRAWSLIAPNEVIVLGSGSGAARAVERRSFAADRDAYGLTETLVEYEDDTTAAAYGDAVGDAAPVMRHRWRSPRGVRLRATIQLFLGDPLRILDRRYVATDGVLLATARGAAAIIDAEAINPALSYREASGYTVDEVSAAATGSTALAPRRWERVGAAVEIALHEEQRRFGYERDGTATELQLIAQAERTGDRELDALAVEERARALQPGDVTTLGTVASVSATTRPNDARYRIDYGVAPPTLGDLSERDRYA